MVKLIFDGCTGLIWGDDLQVIELNSRVYRGHKDPRTVITIYTIGDSYHKICENCQQPMKIVGIIVTKARNERFCSIDVLP
jgi:Endodeoxyribonuclease RusA